MSSFNITPEINILNYMIYKFSLIVKIYSRLYSFLILHKLHIFKLDIPMLLVSCNRFVRIRSLNDEFKATLTPFSFATLIADQNCQQLYTTTYEN